MNNIGPALLVISLFAIKSAPLPKLGVKNSEGRSGKGFPVIGRIIIDQWWLEGPFWVKRPDTEKSLPKQKWMEKVSLSI